MTPWKGQHIFLRAAAIVRREIPDARFQIVGAALFGEADYEREMRELCSQLELDEAVEWLGFRRDVPHVIAQMDALVHASTTGEPFGQVLIEGMAAARPVELQRAAAACPKSWSDGITGILVPMNQIEPLAAAMLELWRDPKRASNGRNGARVRAKRVHHPGDGA